MEKKLTDDLAIAEKDGGKRRYSYDTLSKLSGVNRNFGYYTELRNGRPYHCLRRDLILSVQKYGENGSLKVNLYNAGEMESYELTTDNAVHYSDYIEITYVIEGSIRVFIDGEPHVFGEKELYLINPNLAIREDNSRTSATVLNISMQLPFFDELLLADIREHTLQEFLRNCLIAESRSQKYLHFSPASDEVQQTLSELVSGIFMEYRGQQPGCLLIIKGYFVRLLDHLARYYRFTLTADKKNQYAEYLFLEVKRYMYQHCGDMRMQDLTDTFHYQSNYFNKLIHNFTGMSYSRYLIRIRMERAAELLSESDRDIDEIMELCGYHNKGFFYQEFTAVYELTPAKYRKRLRSGAAASDGTKNTEYDKGQ